MKEETVINKNKALEDPFSLLLLSAPNSSLCQVSQVIQLLFDTKKLSQSGDEVSICVQKWIRASEGCFVTTTKGTWVIDESLRRISFRRKNWMRWNRCRRGWESWRNKEYLVSEEVCRFYSFIAFVNKGKKVNFLFSLLLFSPFIFCPRILSCVEQTMYARIARYCTTNSSESPNFQANLPFHFTYGEIFLLHLTVAELLKMRDESSTIAHLVFVPCYSTRTSTHYELEIGAICMNLNGNDGKRM